MKGQRWLSKRVPIRSKIKEITPDLATDQCWYEPAESLARGQSPKLVSPRRLPPSRHKPVMSCNLEGSADATRRSQRPSSKSYFNQSRNQATDMTVSIPEDGLGSLRTPCRKADQKTGGWVGKTETGSTFESSISTTSPLLRFCYPN